MNWPRNGRHCRKLRTDGYGGRAAMGEGKYRPLRRRRGERDHLRRKRRLVCREYADGVAHGQGVCSEGASAKAAEPSAMGLALDSLQRSEKKGESFCRLAWRRRHCPICALCLSTKVLAAVMAKEGVGASQPSIDGKLLTESSLTRMPRVSRRMCRCWQDESRRSSFLARRHDSREMEGQAAGMFKERGCGLPQELSRRLPTSRPRDSAIGYGS